MKYIITFLMVVGLSFGVRAQYDTKADSLISIQLDSAVNIKATRLNVEAFIHQIVTDTSFYEAFRQMKRYNFQAVNSITTFDKKGRKTARVYRKMIRTAPNHLKYLVNQDSGKVFKKQGKYNQYTVEMFDYIFRNAYTSAYSASGNVKPAGSNASYKDKLKTLLFSPGRPVKGIPFIGSKTEIFSPNLRQYYDYSFYSGTYMDSIPVYTFKVKLKPDLSSWTKDGMMIKELNTIFDKRSLQILGRSVTMKYDNLAFDFDVKMDIQLGYFDGGNALLPTKVSYQGNWNVPFKKEERSAFIVLHSGYQKPQ